MQRFAVVVALAALCNPVVLTAQPLEPRVRYEADFLSADFHQSRRDAVIAALPENAVAFVFGAPERTRSNDVSYEYRQSSDLLYLTGSSEPGTVLLLAPRGVSVDGRVATEILFVPPRDPSQEVWLGRRFGAERATDVLGVQLAVDATRFREIVSPLLADETTEVYHLPLPDGVPRASPLADQIQTVLEHAEPLVIVETGLAGFVLNGLLSVQDDQTYAQMKAISAQGFDPAQVSDPTLREAARAFVASATHAEWSDARGELLEGRPDGITLRTVLDALRSVKTDEEMTVLRKAIDVTAEAHRTVMRQVEPGWAEYEIEALVEYTFKRGGAEHPGFPSIVGSGENAVILHYETNRRTTEPGDVVVIDIGAEFHGYSADITRTLPVSGTYTPEQRVIYELVYQAREAGIDAARAGNGFGAAHVAASRVLAAGLAELGLISGPRDQAGLSRFFMHGTSHYLGLDVHDVGTGGALEPGTVITVEPGLYIPAAEDIDPKWWNIGVRIEDDVLVTEGDPVVLSAAVPRQVDAVEALMRERPIS